MSDLFTTGTAAQELAREGVKASVESVRRWVDLGLIVATKMPTGLRLITRAELERFIASKRSK